MIIQKRYLHVDTVLEADKFDRAIGSYISLLYRFGVASYPDKKAALFFDYCERINLKVSINPWRTLMWLDNCEEGVKTILANQCYVKNSKYGNIRGLIENKRN